jgi:NAD(P)-dependent dehydrogenase (short-subunit alcohol dehydrogenase family)
MFDLSGKTALVTGAATGLGKQIAVTLAKQGAALIISDLPGCSLESTGADVREFGTDPLKLELDVRMLSSINQCAEEVFSRFGVVEILVNNAGINRPSSGLDVTEAEWDDHFATNVRGGMFLAQALAPGMIKRQWGRVIWIASQSGLVGIPGQPAYCSTKGAVIQLVRTLGLEWARHGITVNSVAPTFVETDLTRKRLQNPEFLKFVLNKIPVGKLAEPEHVSAAVAFLASEEACMVNCHTLTVDGGWTAW